jgi:hypothetical protein
VRPPSLLLPLSLIRIMQSLPDDTLLCIPNFLDHHPDCMALLFLNTSLRKRFLPKVFVELSLGPGPMDFMETLRTQAQFRKYVQRIHVSDWTPVPYHMWPKKEDGILRLKQGDPLHEYEHWYPEVIQEVLPHLVNLRVVTASCPGHHLMTLLAAVTVPLIMKYEGNPWDIAVVLQRPHSAHLTHLTLYSDGLYGNKGDFDETMRGEHGRLSHVYPRLTTTRVPSTCSTSHHLSYCLRTPRHPGCPKPVHHVSQPVLLECFAHAPCLLYGAPCPMGLRELDWAVLVVYHPPLGPTFHYPPGLSMD